MSGASNGPVSTLPGASWAAKPGVRCDNHPKVFAALRIQGETDSMGCEYLDVCQPCADAIRAEADSPEAKQGRCDWCEHFKLDLRNRRDQDEGRSGKIYRVCGDCVKRDSEEADLELGDGQKTFDNTTHFDLGGTNDYSDDYFEEG